MSLSVQHALAFKLCRHLATPGFEIQYNEALIFLLGDLHCK